MKHLLTALLCAGLLCAFEAVEITGKLSVKGSEPFSYLALSGHEGKVYKLTGPRAEELRTHQGEKVTVTARITKEAVGPGFPAEAEVEAYTFLP